MTTQIFVAIFVFAILGVSSHKCSLHRGADGNYFANCRERHLEQVPADIPKPGSVTSLDLSLNNIKSLGANAFRQFPNLVSLNLSTAGIHELDETAFRGLPHLKTLDLTSNEVLARHAVPDQLFSSCDTITRLYISGSYLGGKLFKPLSDLEELTMSPHRDYMPYELAKLTKLRVLNFAFCEFSGNLTRALLEPFSRSPLDEMSFHGCDLVDVENGCFDDFMSLRLLNFACNVGGSVHNILDALSTSDSPEIDTLILDAVGVQNVRDSVVLDVPVNNSCRKIWSSLKHISVRSIHLIGFEHPECFTEIMTLAAGFNAPLFVFPEYKNGHLFNLKNLRYLDISYLMVVDRDAVKHLLMCSGPTSWIPPNHSYFPERVPRWEDEKCDPNDTKAYLEPDTGRCPISVLPPCLLYVRVDHLAYIGETHSDGCIQYTYNNLRYLNYSHRLHDKAWNTTLMHVYGLSKLEILDISAFGINEYSAGVLRSAPGLTALYAHDNNLGFGNIPQFPALENFTTFDVSFNAIFALREDVFANLPALSTLILRGNYLKAIQWLLYTPRSLAWLDLENNKLESVNVSIITKFDSALHESILSLDIRENPLQCGCQDLGFIKWLRTTSMNVLGKQSLVCSEDGKNAIIHSIDINALSRACLYTKQKIILCSVVFGMTAVFVTCSLMIYKYRWKIKWKYYKARYLSKKSRADTLLRSSESANLFSTFIIYPIEDNSIRPWVVGSLRNHIETEWQRSECFMRGRNDDPGSYHIDAVIGGLTQSQTALWVICPAFFEDKWCETAANFAFHHLGVRNNALLIMEDRFESYRVPRNFVNLLNPKLNMRRLAYSTDEDGKRLFWSMLQEFVPV